MFASAVRRVAYPKYRVAIIYMLGLKLHRVVVQTEL